jgi:Leucine-rich repeat (LRR) protein
MITSKKMILWALGLAFVFVAIVWGYLFYQKHKGSVGQGTSSSTSSQPIAMPIDTGVEVTSAAVAAQNPGGVFRLDLKFQGPSTISLSLPPAPVPLSAYVSSSLFSSMQNLTLLNVDGDDLNSLPPEIGNLKNLQVLYLSNNQLTSLPPEIGNLKNLWMLSLFQNKLTSLPRTIANLKNLKVLGLTGNPIVQSSTAMAALEAELPPGVQIIK